jgi:hypothetical protein
MPEQILGRFRVGRHFSASRVSIMASHRYSDLLVRFPVHNWIIWVGAGISVSPPTRLPLGEPLTHFALDAACGEPVRRAAMEVWRRASAVAATPVQPVPFGSLPRLESLLGAIADVERDAPDPSVRLLPGMSAFADAPPNSNHHALALLVLRGATVITTNFDLGVERALDRIAGRVGACTPLDHQGAFRRYVLDSSLGAGEVIHIHGVADDLASLGMTLSRIKEGLSPAFTSYLERRLANGALLVVAGYSVSDSFDVTPYFAARPSGCWPGSALLFVQHGGGEAPRRLPEMAAGFGATEVLGVNTGEFLATLGGGAPPGGGDDFSWDDEFRRKLSGFRSAAAAPLLTCAVANALGMNVDVLDRDAFARAEAGNPGYHPREYHYVLMIAARGKGDGRKEVEHHRMGGGGATDLLGYHYARGDLRRAGEHAMSVDEILSSGRGKGEVPWRPYTSLSVHCRLLLNDYLTRPWKVPSPAEESRVDRLLQATEVLGERPLGEVEFIHQVATALRFRLLLSSLLPGELNATLEAQVLGLYAEQANAAGFVSSYRDFALARILLLRRAAGAQRTTLAQQAGELAGRSSRLARLLGDEASVRRASRLRALLWVARISAAVSEPFTRPRGSGGSRG